MLSAYKTQSILFEKELKNQTQHHTYYPEHTEQNRSPKQYGRHRNNSFAEFFAHNKLLFPRNLKNARHGLIHATHKKRGSD